MDFAKLLPEQEKAETEEDNRLSRSVSKESEKFSRHNSISSDNSHDDSKDDGLHERRMEEEKRAEGSIGWQFYNAYIRASGGYSVFSFVLVMFLLAQLCASAGDYFLTYWVSKEEKKFSAPQSTLRNNSSSKLFEVAYKEDDTFLERIQKISQVIMNDPNIDIYIFSTLTIATVVLTLSRSFLFFNVAMRASKSLHDAMFDGITRATMYFFNTNPSGRVINRFSKDIGQIDEVLPMTIVDVFQIFLALAGIISVVTIVNTLTLIPTICIAVLFYYLRKFYLMSSRNLKRMDAVTRSPIFSHLAATLNGLSTIRAFNAEEVLSEEFDNHQDLNSTAFFLFLAASRAFGFWLDFTLCVYIALVILSFFVMENSGGNVGLAITQVFFSNNFFLNI